MYLDNPSIKEKIFVFSEAELLYQNASYFESEDEWLDFLETFMDIETGVQKREFHDDEPRYFPCILIESPSMGTTEDGRPCVFNTFIYPNREHLLEEDHDDLGVC